MLKPQTDDTPRCIAGLQTAEQFLLSALRLWGHGRGEAQCCCRIFLRNGFHAAGLLATEFETFDRVLSVIDFAMKGRTWIGERENPMVADDEGIYLRALALCQHGAYDDAARILGGWLSPYVASMIFDELDIFAQACATVGLLLVPPGDVDERVYRLQ